MTRVRLMDGNVFEHRVIEVTEPLLAAGLAPVSGGHGHVVVAFGGNGLERPGSIHGGTDIGGVRGGRTDQAARLGRDRDQVALQDKAAQSFQRGSYVIDDRFGRWMMLFQVAERGADAASRADGLSRAFRRGHVPLDVRPNQALELTHVQGNHLAGLQ